MTQGTAVDGASGAMNKSRARDPREDACGAKVMDKSKGVQRAHNGGGWRVDQGDNISFYRICFIFHSFWPKASASLILFYFIYS